MFLRHTAIRSETETLSLHDALPIWLTDQLTASRGARCADAAHGAARRALDFGGASAAAEREQMQQDRKSTRLNSSYSSISYAVFCLKKKKLTLHRRPL